ncbi:MAG: bifunctional riboflavin kinase/FAD synthetase [Beijerinckiaceae bacterium]
MTVSIMEKPFFTLENPDTLPPALAQPVVAIGNFDGVHLGHTALLQSALAMAHPLQRPSAVLTFSPHPRRFFQPEKPLFQLTPQKMKARLLAEAGMQAMIELRFDASFAALTADQFIEDILVKRMRVSGVVIGHDFHFGRQRQGTPDFLVDAGKKHGFETSVVKPRMLDGTVVSSSHIRSLLADGDIADATRMLGREWCVESVVQHGDKRGRELGYPTANLHLDPAVTLKHGIYAVRAIINGNPHAAIASFGSRPTFDNGAPKLEVHVFDYSADLYDQEIEIKFVGYIRPELKFDGIEALIKQMDADSLQARAILAA